MVWLETTWLRFLPTDREEGRKPLDSLGLAIEQFLILVAETHNFRVGKRSLRAARSCLVSAMLRSAPSARAAAAVRGCNMPEGPSLCGEDRPLASP